MNFIFIVSFFVIYSLSDITSIYVIVGAILSWFIIIDVSSNTTSLIVYAYALWIPSLAPALILYSYAFVSSTPVCSYGDVAF